MERDERWEAKRKHSCLPTKRRPERAALLTLRAIQATAIEVPMARPLGTSAQTMGTAPLLLIDLETEEGITGQAYLFCYTPMAPG
jgi:Mandelate racemase / muconate lactonizing enzyme, N-terminal domain